MQHAWTFADTAVTLELVDFADPALAGEPDVRERGVRLEVRPLTWTTTGSIYSSPAMTLEPAVLRVDLLESAPGAADRMHWHPRMADGEPGDREFDPSMVADPAGWVRRWLTDRAVTSGAVDEVVAAVERGLERVREPWPDVVHDERGLAPV